MNEIRKKMKFNDDELKEIDKILEKFYGEIPFIYQHMPERIKGPFFVKSDSLFRSPDSKLSLKEKELIALSASTALKCPHCQEVHIKSALDQGISVEEIQETIFISAAIAESSSLAFALRTLENIKSNKD